MQRRAFIAGLGLAVAGPAILGRPAAAHPSSATPRAGTAPPPPPREMAGLIGEYGTAADLLIVLEREGAMYVLGKGAPQGRLAGVRDVYAPYDRAAGAPRLVFERRRGAGSAVTLNGRRYPRVDLGAEVEARIRAGVRADPARLRAEALAAPMPAFDPPKRRTDLVDLARIDPALRFDIRYATADNFMGMALYDRPAAFLQRPAAQALVRAHESLRSKGYGLLIHDAYRPWFVTKMFWDATPPASRAFVGDPARGSRHNRGAAVDLTLFDLAAGKVVEMPSRYDEFSARAAPDYPGGTSRQRWLRALLRREMQAQGFEVYPQEWWHFDHEGWRDYAIENRTFDRLARGS